MVNGSCNCGDWTYEYQGDPVMEIVCHCIPCRKTAGANGSTNTAVMESNFTKKSGATKNWKRKGISGKDVTYSLCDTCGTIMTVALDASPGVVILKTGTIDDRSTLDAYKPNQEIFTKDRPHCFAALEGLQQKEVA